ncbi:glycosyl hydrolase [Flagelloscypha sp. PMI_526]|nr:glycosyl hydrolase [Flagelloscypha sp. PMI_526]
MFKASATWIVLSSLFAAHLSSAVAVWGQCGGTTYQGENACDIGTACVNINDGYSQCQPSTTDSTVPTLTPRADGNYTNPVFWEDLADLAIKRVGSTYYYSASTMHFSPGAPILRSYDLVHWEYIGHSVPTLSFGDTKYDLNGGRAYIRGIWASFFDIDSNGVAWWGGCIDFAKTYIYSAPSVTGTWSQVSVLSTCFYDAGSLIDSDGTMYIAYGNTQISVAQLSSDKKSIVRTASVYNSTFTIEGSRMYKTGGYYYIFVTRPADGQFILRSTSPWGPYTLGAALTGWAGGIPHQGALVDTPSGGWYYMAFLDAYPGGRVPSLAPITWSNGWPSLTKVNGAWGNTYPYTLTSTPVASPTGTDTFTGSSLSHNWEWNHNPDTSKYGFANPGLILKTATVTSDFNQARNTLTHRILGPKAVGTIQLNVASMANGDAAGLALMRDASAWVGVKKSSSGTYTVNMVTGIAMDVNNTWATTSTGTTSASVSLTSTTIYLRITVDINPGTGKLATFAYSTNGSTFTSIGGSFTLTTQWQFFMGYRFGIFNYATSALGGQVTVNSFTMNSA